MDSDKKYTHWVTMITSNESPRHIDDESNYVPDDTRRWRRIVACYSARQAEFILGGVRHWDGCTYAKIKDKEPIYSDKTTHVEWYSMTSKDGYKLMKGRKEDNK